MTRLLVAGTASGVGKTTVTLMLLALLRRRGLAPQPFKGGPDFLDTMHHTQIAGRTSRNLDTWMLSAEANRDVFASALPGAQAAVVEGMMGLFDGKSGRSEEGSSAELAKLLDLPVVLVVDASTSARSVAAVVLGFESFDPALTMGGVVLNRVAGQHHAALLKEAITTRCRTPILGWLPREERIEIPERHLGLHAVQARERPAAIEQRLELLAAMAEEHLDLEAVLRLGSTGLGVPRSASSQEPLAARTHPPVRIGVARDDAFCFYYQDNLDLLQQAGAEIVSFSPLRDAVLPPELDGLYLGGGYPELHAAQLSTNRTMREQIRGFTQSGRPVYAECGGMLYLGQDLTTADHTSWPMAGALPLRFEMTERLVDFGYVDVISTQDTLLGPAGLQLRGQSFHYSRFADTPDVPTAYQISFSLSGKRQSEGFVHNGILATYVHLHFRSAPEVAGSFVAAARRARRIPKAIAH